jgi:hypothetical protein
MPVEGAERAPHDVHVDCKVELRRSALTFTVDDIANMDLAVALEDRALL